MSHQVVAAVFRRNGRILLCRRSLRRGWYPGIWDLPGGHVEGNESDAAALVRECREELGVDVIEPPEVPVATLRASVSPGEDGFDLAVWVFDAWDGEITNCAPDEHDELRWVSRDEVPGLALAHPGYADLLGHLLA